MDRSECQNHNHKTDLKPSTIRGYIRMRCQMFDVARAAGVMHREKQSSLARENKRNRLVSIHENRDLLNLLTIDACSVVYV